MAFCKLLTVLVLIHKTGGVLGAQVESSIIGGQNARKGNWPWMVHLNITDGKNRWRCGGTILNSEWLLTAAHCFDKTLNVIANRSMAWLGSHDLRKASSLYRKILFSQPHHKYQALSTGYQNDIALVKLTAKIKFSENVVPVTLPSETDTFGSSQECWIIGWGNIGNDVPLPEPETLQQLKIPIIPHSVCKDKYPDLKPDVLCAGDMAGGKDACKGDYGGPLMCRTARGFVQAGIMSYGSPDGCGLPGRPGVYTSVSKYLSFINDYIHHGEEASAEV